MAATAVSRINKRICAIINRVNKVCLTDGPLLPSKVKSKWPAILFAVRCTVSILGRNSLLIVSMITMKGISMVGVP